MNCELFGTNVVGSQFQKVCWYLSAMNEEKHKILTNDRSSYS
jgi:hypothetical protein